MWIAWLSKTTMRSWFKKLVTARQMDLCRKLSTGWTVACSCDICRWLKSTPRSVNAIFSSPRKNCTEVQQHDVFSMIVRLGTQRFLIFRVEHFTRHLFEAWTSNELCPRRKSFVHVLGVSGETKSSIQVQRREPRHVRVRNIDHVPERGHKFVKSTRWPNSSSLCGVRLGS